MLRSEIDSLIQISRAALSPVLSRSGKILYSSVETLQPGPMYILGLNPGGDPDEEQDSHYSIAEALERLPNKVGNDYIDECWQGSTVPGARPVQRRIQWLCRALGCEPREVCASNLIFLRSRDGATSEYPQSADLCWPVHEYIFKIVQPRLVLVFDSRVYRYVGMRFGGKRFRTCEVKASGHGKWGCRRAVVPLFGASTNLVQVPHLSRYAINRHPEIVDWIRLMLEPKTAP